MLGQPYLVIPEGLHNLGDVEQDGVLQRRWMSNHDLQEGKTIPYLQDSENKSNTDGCPRAPLQPGMAPLSLSPWDTVLQRTENQGKPRGQQGKWPMA